MDKFAENIYNLCEAVIPYAPAVAVVALLLIGGMFAIPSDESRQKAKKALAGVAIGMFLIVGAVYLGKWYLPTSLAGRCDRFRGRS